MLEYLLSIFSICILIGIYVSFWVLFRGKVLTAILLPTLIIFPTFIIRPLMIITGIGEPYPSYLFGRDDFTLIAHANILIAIWLLCYLAVFFMPNKTQMLPKLFPAFKSDPSVITILITCIALTLCSLLAELYVIQEYGSLARFMYAVKVLKDITGQYYLKYFPFLGGLVSCYGLLLAMRGKNKFLGITFSIAALTNFFVIFSFGERFTIGLISIAFILTALRNKSLSFKRASILLTVCLIILFTLSNFRYSFVRDGQDDNRSWGFAEEISASLHLSEYDALLLLVRDFGLPSDAILGHQFYIGLTALVPRQIWPDRPNGVNPGKWFRHQYEPNMENGWPITVVGEWYLNFGFLGIIVGAILSGYIARCMFERYHTPKNSKVTWNFLIGTFLSIQLLYGGIRVISIQQSFYFCLSLAILSLLIFIANSLLKVSDSRR